MLRFLDIATLLARQGFDAALSARAERRSIFLEFTKSVQALARQWSPSPYPRDI